MKRKANVTLIGAFVVGGLALLTLATSSSLARSAP